MSSKRISTHLRAGLAGAAIILTGVAVYWVALPENRAMREEPQERLAATSSRAAPGEVSSPPRKSTPANAAATSPDTQAQAPAIDDTEVATVAQYTAEKYQFLFDDLRYLHKGQVERLQKTLLTRELLAGAIKAAREGNGPPVTSDVLARQEQALAKAEAEIRGVLRPTDYATYEALKDSDEELYKLNEYAGGVSNVAPLSAEDRKAILKTKLAYKERYRQLLEDSGLNRENLSTAEREYAYSVTSRAMQDYKRSYLQEVRQYLANEEQYVLLSNYENTEFQVELEKLQAKANGF